MNKAVTSVCTAGGTAGISCVTGEKRRLIPAGGEDSPKRDQTQEDDKRQGEDFSVELGMATVDFVVIELCCVIESQVCQATRRLHGTYVGVH